MELCVDNLQPDFLYDHIQPVRAELFQVSDIVLKNLNPIYLNIIAMYMYTYFVWFPCSLQFVNNIIFFPGTLENPSQSSWQHCSCSLPGFGQVWWWQQKNAEGTPKGVFYCLTITINNFDIVLKTVAYVYYTLFLHKGQNISI